MTDDVSKDMEKDQEKPGPGLTEKKTLIVLAVAITLFLIVVIAVSVTLLSPPEKGTVQPGGIQNTSQPGNKLSSAQTTNGSKTILQTVTHAIPETPAPQATTTVPVDFILLSGNPTSCGLTCRQLDATLTNSGYMTAHDVCIAVSMHNSRNEIINLNGDSSLNRCVGDIAGGQTITESISINADCGMFATRCLGETLTLQTQVTSDEKTVRFPDLVISV